MLNTLRSVTRAPHRLIDAMRVTTETARRLPCLQRVVCERLGSLDRGVRDGLALLGASTADLERVRATVETPHERVTAIERGLGILPGLAADLERVRAIVEPQHERVVRIEQAVARLDLHLTELKETLVLVKGRRRRRHRTPPRPRRARTHHTRARNTITGGV